MEQGILPRGGATLALLSREISEFAKTLTDEDERVGAAIVQAAIPAPLKQICPNAGVESAIVLEKVREQTDFNYGYNSQTEEYVTHKRKSGLCLKEEMGRT